MKKKTVLKLFCQFCYNRFSKVITYIYTFLNGRGEEDWGFFLQHFQWQPGCMTWEILNGRMRITKGTVQTVEKRNVLTGVTARIIADTQHSGKRFSSLRKTEQGHESKQTSRQRQANARLNSLNARTSAST